MTGIGGVNPAHFDDASRKRLHKLLFENLNNGQVRILASHDWFSRWIRGAQEMEHTNVTAPTCYSGHYRMAVSPFVRAADQENTKRRTVCGVRGMLETDQMWVSLCTYRRYNPRFGFEWSGDMPTLLARRAQIMKDVEPLKVCQEVACQLADHNATMHEAVSRLSTNRER